MERSEALLDAIVDLDMVLLKAHTEAAGDRFDRAPHRRALAERLEHAEIIDIWRENELIAYSFVWPKTNRWFVGGFAIRPDHRNAAIMCELIARLLVCTRTGDQSYVESHVYKTNRLSMGFHQRLGFRTIRENRRGVAFIHRINELTQLPIVVRALSRLE